MDVSTLTVSDFKAQFWRDFPYLPVFNVGQIYNAGTRVYYPTTLLFYDCTVNGTQGVLPTNTSNWAVASDNTINYVQDADISQAMADAIGAFNGGLFGTDVSQKNAYLLLAAHNLALNIRMAGAGIASAGSFTTTARSVGNVSETYGVPEAYLKNPLYSYYTQTMYGLKYLALALPNLVGNVLVIGGGTQP